MNNLWMVNATWLILSSRLEIKNEWSKKKKKLNAETDYVSANETERIAKIIDQTAS